MIYVKVDQHGRATHIIDDKTGSRVNLTGLSPDERAYCLMVAGHDPKTYDGSRGPDCLIGQVRRLFHVTDSEPYPGDLALICRKEMTLDSYDTESLAQRLDRIYHLAAEKPYDNDGQEALDMAEEELGVDLDNLPKEMENFPAPGSDGS